MTNAEEGFSTLEALVAFAILSLGLLAAVQSISQAAMSLKKSVQGQQEISLLDRIQSEEMPNLVRAYTGVPIVREGENWRMELAPLWPDRREGPIRFEIRIGQGNSPETNLRGVVSGPK